MTEDNNLIPEISGKTLIIKDGDTVLSEGVVSEAMEEMREIYDEWKTPTMWQTFRRRGIKAVLNRKLERMCSSVIHAMHKDAREHGFNLVRPEYKAPWWFSLVSKIEFWSRPKPKRRRDAGS